MIQRIRQFRNLIEVANAFADEGKALDFLAKERWGDSVPCLKCGCTQRVYRCKSLRYHCSNCNHNFSAKVGTIFENSKLNLQKWFMAIYLVLSHKNGISSCQLARDINVSQRTAWFMLMKIRFCIIQERVSKLQDEIEVDEVFIGGLNKWKHRNRIIPHTQGRSTKTKQPILGMIERNGDVVAIAIDEVNAVTVLPIINKVCETPANIYTDECQAYKQLPNYGFQLSIVNHHQGQYVDGDATTNRIENYWSVLKKPLFATYRGRMTHKYMQHYVDVSVFRFNCRELHNENMFYLAFPALLAKKLTYKNITDNLPS